MFAETDSVLHNHLHQPRAKNATCLSPRSQNEIINVIGYDVIRASIIAEVTMSGEKSRVQKQFRDNQEACILTVLCIPSTL